MEERQNTLYISTSQNPAVECACKGRASQACVDRGCVFVRAVLVKGNSVTDADGDELEKSLVKSARRLVK